MDQQLPEDIRKIPSPLIAFCGDNSLSVFIADRFFQDGSSRYSIEFLSDQQDSNSTDMKNDEKFEGRTIMKGSWYKKHSHRQPALCLFCISIDLVQLSQERGKWLQMVSEQFSIISNQFSGKKPSFISLFVCPGNKESLAPNGLREDVLIRDLNTLTIDHLHSYLFFEEELIGSSLSSIKSLKAEVFQICHNYYSDRLDILDSDMHSLNPENPPEQIIRVMLKMSFFNECLSSLNLQESNAIYSYNRCLEHYLRVQDYCISLFSEMQTKRNEEIRQILSLVNFKVVLYSLLIQQSKGIIQLTKKITRCIHAVSAILCDDSSALFSLWKATQYQFIIDEFTELNTDANLSSDVRECLQSCYFYRMYYAREAYILSFEHSLCSSLSPNGKPHSRDFSDSLFLSTNWYANEEEYLTALMDQIQFDVIFEDSYKVCIQNNVPSFIHSSILDLITRILTEMKLPSDEEETRIVQILLQFRLFSLLKLLLLPICYLSYYHRLQSKLIHSLLLLNNPAIPLANESRVLFYHYCCDHFGDLTPFHLDTLLVPIEWCLLTDHLCVKENEQVPVKLVLKNPFPCLITVKKIQWLKNTEAIERIIQPDSIGFVNLTFPAKSLQIQPIISLQLEEFPSSFVLSPFFCTLSQTPFDLNHVDLDQVQILPPFTPLLNVPSEETVIIGRLNSIELPLMMLSEPITVEMSYDNKEIEEVCEYKREGSLSRLFIDLRDPKWFGKQSFCTYSIVVRTEQQEQRYILKLSLKQPFDVITDLGSYQGHFYSMYKNQLSITIHSLLESITIQNIEYSGNDDIKWKCLSDSKTPVILNLNEDYHREFAIQTTTQEEKDIQEHCFQIHYSIMNEPGLCQVTIPAIHMEKPPIVYTVNLNSTLVKGEPCDGSICITNNAEKDQMVLVTMKKDGTRWIMNGVMEHNYSIPPGHSIIHSFSIIPIQAGSQDYSLCSILLSNLSLQIEGFFPPNHVFVKDSDCIL